MLKAIYGLYADPDSAQRAVDSLRAAGVDERAISVASSEPFEEYEFGRREQRTPMAWLAALGGLVGGVSGYLLSSLTQKAYPLPTGGMPLAPLWTNGIITYELTMLGAILATLAILLVSARLPNWKPQLYDPAISDGYILVGVVSPPEALRIGLERTLREAGASEVKELVVGLDAEPRTQGVSE